MNLSKNGLPSQAHQLSPVLNQYNSRIQNAKLITGFKPNELDQIELSFIACDFKRFEHYFSRYNYKAKNFDLFLLPKMIEVIEKEVK